MANKERKRERETMCIKRESKKHAKWEEGKSSEMNATRRAETERGVRKRRRRRRAEEEGNSKPERLGLRRGRERKEGREGNPKGKGRGGERRDEGHGEWGAD